MKQKLRHIIHFLIVVILSTLISNTVLAEIVFENQIELEEKEVEEIEHESYFDSCPQNVENISIADGGKVKVYEAPVKVTITEPVFNLITLLFLPSNNILLAPNTIAFYIRYCSLIIYS